MAQGPWHDTAALREEFRRAVLRALVRRAVFEPEDADAMLTWPHSGFHVHDAVWVSDGNTPFALRLARYCARNPVALERLTYEPKAPNAPVRYRSDKTEGPTAGTETVDPLEFLARVTAHIPGKHKVMTRYSGGTPTGCGGGGAREGRDAAGVVVAPRETRAAPRERCAGDRDWNSYRHAPSDNSLVTRRTCLVLP